MKSRRCFRIAVPIGRLRCRSCRRSAARSFIACLLRASGPSSFVVVLGGLRRLGRAPSASCVASSTTSPALPGAGGAAGGRASAAAGRASAYGGEVRRILVLARRVGLERRLRRGGERRHRTVDRERRDAGERPAPVLCRADGRCWSRRRRSRGCTGRWRRRSGSRRRSRRGRSRSPRRSRPVRAVVGVVGRARRRPGRSTTGMITWLKQLESARACSRNGIVLLRQLRELRHRRPQVGDEAAQLLRTGEQPRSWREQRRRRVERRRRSCGRRAGSRGRRPGSAGRRR